MQSAIQYTHLSSKHIQPLQEVNEKRNYFENFCCRYSDAYPSMAFSHIVLVSNKQDFPTPWNVPLFSILLREARNQEPQCNVCCTAQIKTTLKLQALDALHRSRKRFLAKMPKEERVCREQQNTADVVYSGMKCSCTYQRNYFRCYTLNSPKLESSI